MKVLITGNKGYIGTVLSKALLAQRVEVVGLDTGYYDGCNFLDDSCRIRQIAKDIRNVSKDDLRGINAVIHLAALSNDPMGELNPRLTSEINHLASVRLASLTRDCGVRRFIFSSSCSVYGKSGAQMIDENGRLSPSTEYAKSKVAAERDIAGLANGVFSPVFLRNATVYGISPMLRVDLVVNNLSGWAHTTKEIRVMSDGSPWRPLIHIQDLCRAFLSVLRAPREKVHNQIFNVGQEGGNYRVRDIVETVKKVLPGCKIEYTGEHGPDTRTYRVDFSKFNAVFEGCFKSSWDIGKGVYEILDNYKKSQFQKSEFLGDKFTRLKRIEKLLREGRVDKDLFWLTPGHIGLAGVH